MDGPSFNENDITKENFSDIASEKISHILCFPGNGLYRTWAVKFFQKASRGFGLGDHEPWLKSLSTFESSEVILSHCKSSIRKLDMITPSLNSYRSFIISYPLQFKLFISSLASLLISQIEESEKSLPFNLQISDGRISLKSENRNYYENVCGSHTQKKNARNISDSGPSKKIAINGETQSLNIDENINFLKHVWSWARASYVKLDAVLLGDVLSNLPECIEEVVLSWTKEMLVNRQSRIPSDIKGSTLTSFGCSRGTVPSDDDMLHSLSVIQESPLFLAAAASSHKLFQKSSSVLNQLLIQSSECSCSWSSMLSLCKTFAQETAKGRAEFYPLEVQPLILLMEVDPNTLSSNEQREIISSQLTSMCTSLPIEVVIAVLSHFPAWLPLLDHVTML